MLVFMYVYIWNVRAAHPRAQFLRAILTPTNQQNGGADSFFFGVNLHNDCCPALLSVGYHSMLLLQFLIQV